MEDNSKIEKLRNTDPHKNKVHKILAHSYSVYFILFLVGVYLDFVFKIKIFTNSLMVPIGFSILMLSTLLIIWAQSTTRDFKKDDGSNVSKETFCRGPYCYTRSPTHWGLFFLILGFGIITNAFFVILSACISFIITKFIFLDKQEKVLAEKYGTHYVEYKKSVKL